LLCLTLTCVKGLMHPFNLRFNAGLGKVTHPILELR
jgi:hypothetical protein